MTDVLGQRVEPRVAHGEETGRLNGFSERRQTVVRHDETEDARGSLRSISGKNNVDNPFIPSWQEKVLAEHRATQVPNITSQRQLDHDVATGIPEKFLERDANFRDSASLLSVKPESRNLTDPNSHHTVADSDSEKGPESTQTQALGLQADEKENFLKLSPAKIHELTSSPNSLPLNAIIAASKDHTNLTEDDTEMSQCSMEFPNEDEPAGSEALKPAGHSRKDRGVVYSPAKEFNINSRRNSMQSTPPTHRKTSTQAGYSNQLSNGPYKRKNPRTVPKPLDLDEDRLRPQPLGSEDMVASPMPSSIPLPPLSLPTYLQLELSSHRPSPLYLHRSATSDFPYESSKVKIDRLKNFLILPFD